MLTSSTLTSWALLIWRTLQERGIEPAPAFQRAQLNPALLGDAQARYNETKMRELWDIAIQLSDDQDFGVAVGQKWCPTTFNALGFAWLASSSLREALQRAHRYARIVNNAVEVQLRVKGAHYCFEWLNSVNNQQLHPAAMDAAVAAVMTMCRAILGPQFTPIAVGLNRVYRPPGKLEAMVGANVGYGHDKTHIIFDARSLDQKLPTGNTLLAQVNETAIVEYLLWLDRTDVVSAVQATLMQLMPSGPVSEEDVAKQLNLGVRTLQRKLKEKGHNFKDLLNCTRQEVTLNHIKNTRLSLTEIAYLVGFTDQANFTRAFKRWTGVSPSVYRKSMAATGVSLEFEAATTQSNANRMG